MRIDIVTLKKIESELGSFDINQTLGGSNDVYLRFGYWRRINLQKLQNLLGVLVKVQEDYDYDDDCGYLYMYRLK